MTKKDKKQLILDTALTLFVGQGYEATSTAALAKAAGVATGTLFHHFPNKEAILKAIFISVKSEFAEIMQRAIGDKSLEETFKSIWFEGIDWALQHPEKANFIQRYCLSPTLKPDIRHQTMLEIFGFVAELVIKGQMRGIIHNYPLMLMMETTNGQFLATTRFFMDHPEFWQDARYRDSSFNMAWGAMCNTPQLTESNTQQCKNEA
ncbi:TetR/AcrR family transcriptional regulator [Veronia pacifica]|uniref:HTH tetR-type domain-containing protein n=1 Tax=Veronia pacifica TaxID=1080227 RepID=A0A1C3EL01_9GAMM|nr:TetR/AcrR family transcriptional regulator [Veronia pacifica]ODA33904.1 hypothetical protein A8L45_08800 [Veronia pacifica]